MSNRFNETKRFLKINLKKGVHIWPDRSHVLYAKFKSVFLANHHIDQTDGQNIGFKYATSMFRILLTVEKYVV